MPASLKSSHFSAKDQAVLPVRRWLPENGQIKAVIVAVHGFNDYSNFFDSAGRYLSQRGIACYAYDQRGFGFAPGWGLWAGADAYGDDLTDFSREVRKHHPDVPLYVLGESMGGAVVIASMTSWNPPDADGVILVAPAVWGRKTMPWYQSRLLSVATAVMPELRLTGEGLRIMPSDNIDMLRKFSRDPKVIKATRIDTISGLTDLMDAALDRAGDIKFPAMVLYGEKDQLIPKEPMTMMLEKMPPGTQVRIYPQGYHMLLRDLHADIPLADILAWIERRQPLNSTMH
ncbi:alpha/beta hydrolase [Candidatus Methylospira mobilis]|nr:alpha/beta hydrolase [Candidatus Methylospira mobilis]WNV04573.1 alpha/beta hydrolase [Candidatus Methylospira mobilis]